MSNPETILPCALCGGDGRCMHFGRRAWRCHCAACGAAGPFDQVKVSAIAAWNLRTHAETVARPVRCAGCGSSKSIEEIRAANPTTLSCCPEREMLDIDQWRERAETVAMAARRQAFEEAAEWRSIETAPLDGTVFLARYQWLGKHRFMAIHRHDTLSEWILDGFGRCVGGLMSGRRTIEFTHWTPILEPPDIWDGTERRNGDRRIDPEEFDARILGKRGGLDRRHFRAAALQTGEDG